MSLLCNCPAGHDTGTARPPPTNTHGTVYHGIGLAVYSHVIYHGIGLLARPHPLPPPPPQTNSKHYLHGAFYLPSVHTDLLILLFHCCITNVVSLSFRGHKTSFTHHLDFHSPINFLITKNRSINYIDSEINIEKRLIFSSNLLQKLHIYAFKCNRFVCRPCLLSHDEDQYMT